MLRFCSLIVMHFHDTRWQIVWLIGSEHKNRFDQRPFDERSHFLLYRRSRLGRHAGQICSANNGLEGLAETGSVHKCPFFLSTSHLTSPPSVISIPEKTLAICTARFSPMPKRLNLVLRKDSGKLQVELAIGPSLASSINELALNFLSHGMGNGGFRRRIIFVSPCVLS